MLRFDVLLDRTFSRCITARMTTPTFPVMYSFRAPDRPMMHASVQRSGAGTILKNNNSIESTRI